MFRRFNAIKSLRLRLQPISMMRIEAPPGAIIAVSLLTMDLPIPHCRWLERNGDYEAIRSVRLNDAFFKGEKPMIIKLAFHLIFSNSGSFPMFAAIRRACSLVSNFAADLRPGSSSK